jgi:nucleotide-binding universal stress UspA family protein
MQRYQRLMVGLTCPEADGDLIRYAAMIARLDTTREIRFVHVLPMSGNCPIPADYESARARVESAVQPHCADTSGTLQVTCDVLTGPLTDRLLTHVAESHVDLLFVGEHRGPADQRALVRRLAMKAPCSVWFVPDGCRASFHRLLVPIDFSDHSAESLRVAASMARLQGRGECLALHVYFNEAAITYEEYDLVLRGQEEHAYRKFVAPVNCQGVKVRPVFEEGPRVSHVIGQVAAEQHADLIVMGTRGRSRSAAILLGSVTEDVIRETRWPLLAVKHFGARLGVVQALLDRNFWHKGAVRTD